ncbi:MAG: hypothetical protein WBF17_12370, partial [Phycisphaerae bacterium]
MSAKHSLVRLPMLTAMLAPSALLQAAKPAEDAVPPNWPTNIAPWNWHTNPGTRYEMHELVKKVPPRDIVIKANIAHWETDEMGTFAVGDTHIFEAVVGDRGSRVFGSVKEGRDGGRLRCTVYWMDAKGKVAREDPAIMKGGCVCSGTYELYLSIPSWAETARHRLNLHYTNERLKMDVSKDLFFHVHNDGSWRRSPLLEKLRAKYPAVAVLQNGQPCPILGVAEYAGTHDTHMLATHSVPDRNADFVNFGGLTWLSIGKYGQANRALIRFDLSRIPRDAAVQEACVQIYVYSTPRRTKPPAIQAFEVLQPWGAGRALGNRWLKDYILPGEASWQCSRHPQKWSAPGCGAPREDRSERPVGSAPAPGQPKGWVTIPLEPAVVRKWLRDP